jgi:RNA polymerase sigma factor (sigma-70 family)
MGGPGTDIGGQRAGFPETSWSLIRRAGADAVASACWNEVVHLYWKPVYWFIRGNWRRSNEDAKDLTQEFFASLLERDVLAGVRDEHVRFRVFLRACLQNFLLSENRDRKRLKRGGGVRIVPLADEDSAPPAGATPEETFDQSWARAVLADSIAALREVYLSSGRETYWKAFERCELAASRPSFGSFRNAQPAIVRRFDSSVSLMVPSCRRARARQVPPRARPGRRACRGRARGRARGASCARGGAGCGRRRG